MRDELTPAETVDRERRRAADRIRDERRDALAKTITAGGEFSKPRRFRSAETLHVEREQDERRWRARIKRSAGGR